MFEFVCSHIYPDCTHVRRAGTREEAIRHAAEHLKGHHDVDALDGPTRRLIDLAVVETRF